MVAAGMIGILCGCNVLNAADATAGLRDKDGFLIDFAAAPVSTNAASGKSARKTNAAPAANAVSSNPVAALPANASASGSTNLPAANVLDDKYRLAIGDQLSFQILEDGDPPVHLVVTDSGDLQVPYIGRYPAVGKTCKQLAQELKVELEKEYYKHATVIVAVDLKPESRGKIYLVGAIRAPGPEDISSDEVLTVSKAILRAGGFTDSADEKHVKVTRSTGTGTGGDKTFIVNVKQILENGKTADDLPVQPGDLIFVPERMIQF
ncbi:MAG TPA: polysaccharide biosynthesis/export family protein [Candidatus Paceibacterota bacterium]|nr:polysaccharide biosynthesis/export family protein [Candidatus Paceibacterota bacterium]